MATEEDRCAEHRRWAAIDAAFRAGDLEGLRAAVEDASVVPNGPMPLAIGPCLVYAIYHSPRRFIAELLALGADPDGADGDGFPPLIAALSCLRTAPGTTGRQDVPAVLSLLLDHGANPDQRGLNDWTPLHMAVAERSLPCVQLLLARGADPTCRTRIDAYDTPREFAITIGATDLAQVLAEAERGR
jgi:ankyrin repeat protein